MYMIITKALRNKGELINVIHGIREKIRQLHTRCI